MIYQIESSRDYDPEPKLGTIVARLLAINSADDQINPPELGIMEGEIINVKRGRFVLLPITEQTRGHGTQTLPAIWGGLPRRTARCERVVFVNEAGTFSKSELVDRDPMSCIVMSCIIMKR